MYISKLELVNWKNFKDVSVELTERCFIVGPNAAGKSNLLDAIRFLRDIAKQGGGLQSAVEDRGGLTKIRCLASRTKTEVSLTVHVSEKGETDPRWIYELSFQHTGGGIVKNQVKIVKENVYSGEKKDWILKRPSQDDEDDKETLKYTYLEQVTANRDFRELKDFFENIEYLNVVPQFVREWATVSLTGKKEDYYGRNFITRLSNLNEPTRKSYFARINEVLRLTVPQLQELSLTKDELGVPHLEVRYDHWRAHKAKQQEGQLSDGTIRMIGFLFAMLDAKGVLLLEEPETNLHTAIVEQLPAFIAKLQRTRKSNIQVFITTHSYEMLSDNGIGAEEVLILKPTNEGTEVVMAKTDSAIKNELSAGFCVADSISDYTRPQNAASIIKTTM